MLLSHTSVISFLFINNNNSRSSDLTFYCGCFALRRSMLFLAKRCARDRHGSSSSHWVCMYVQLLLPLGMYVCMYVCAAITSSDL